MSKELDLIKTTNFDVEFEPATIEIKNSDEIDAMINEVTKNYENTIYAEGDLAGLNQSHLELNKFRKGLDESRKKVKRKYNEPLNKFEKQIKAYIAKVDEPLNEIKSQRDEILEAEEQLRKDALKDYLQKVVLKNKLMMDDIQVETNSWTNKGYWTEKLNPRKKLKDEIQREIDGVIEENKKLIAERELLKQYFKDKDVDASGWIKQLEYTDATEIIKEYQREQEAEKVEADAGAEAEVVDDGVDAEADSKSFDDVLEVLAEEKITNTIEVTGTIEQLNKLNNFLVESDIEVRMIGGK